MKKLFYVLIVFLLFVSVLLPVTKIEASDFSVDGIETQEITEQNNPAISEEADLSLSEDSVIQNDNDIQLFADEEITPQQLATLALNNVGNYGYTKSTVSYDTVRRAALIFIGPNPSIGRDGKSTVYKSADGLRRVRLGPKATVSSQANFEKFFMAHSWQNVHRNGNYHVNIK